jgi:hypothetical protein
VGGSCKPSSPDAACGLVGTGDCITLQKARDGGPVDPRDLREEIQPSIQDSSSGDEGAETDNGSSVSSLEQPGYSLRECPEAFMSTGGACSSSLLSSVGGVTLDMSGSCWGDSSDALGANMRQQLRHEEDVCFSALHSCCTIMHLLVIVLL